MLVCPAFTATSARVVPLHPPRTISLAFSIANSPVPTSTPTTFIPPSAAMGTPTPAKRTIPADVGTCPCGTKTTILPGLRCMPRVSTLARGRAPPQPSGCFLVATDSYAIELRGDFDHLQLIFLPSPHKHLLQRQAEQSRPRSVSLMHPTKAFELELSPFSESMKEH